MESAKDGRGEKNQISNNSYVQNINKSLELPMKVFDSNQGRNHTLKSVAGEEAPLELNSERTGP